MKNAFRALIRGQGIETPKDLWTDQGWAWLPSVPLANELDALRRDMLTECLYFLTRMLHQVEATLNRIASRNAGVHLLESIPVVGPRTAEAVMAWVSDAGRFIPVFESPA